MNQTSDGHVASTANALMFEALVETLRTRGVIEAKDVEAMFLSASTVASLLPGSRVMPVKVSAVIAAMAMRARRREAERAPGRSDDGA